MRILLLGEYSNVHATLSKALKKRGHEVLLISNGDFWKNYPRDIDLSRQYTKLGGLLYWLKVMILLPRLRNFDIVQIINPMFLELKAQRIFPIYNYLKKHNKRIVLCAMGMDHYWVDACTNHKHLRYSDFNIHDQLRTNKDAIAEQKDWLNTSKEALNRHIANTCDAIVSGLYEYWATYQLYFPKKNTFIPFPISIESQPKEIGSFHYPLKIFIGISKQRHEYKGTDIMLQAAKAIATKYPSKVILHEVNGIPFNEYQQIINGSDVLLDQLYSYTPAMNGLLAMSKGIICMGGGEPENYNILNESSLKPIINVEPNYKSVEKALEELVLSPHKIQQLKEDSIRYIQKHHDANKVAKQYEDLYLQLLKSEKIRVYRFIIPSLINKKARRSY